MMSDIRRLLRWGQIIVNVAIIVLAMCICLPLGYVWKYFESNCLLNADVHIKVSQNRTLVELSAARTKWGDDNLCLYTIFLPVVAATHAFIWTWFFICLRIALKENGRDTYLTVPVVVLHTVLCICMVVSSCIVTSGFGGWCTNIMNNIRPKNSFSSCADLQDLYWNLLKGRRSFYTFFLMGEVCSWLLTVVLAFQCVLTVYKFYYEWTWELSPPDKEKAPLTPGVGQFGPYPGPESETASLNSSRTSGLEESLTNSSRSLKPKKSKPI